MVKIASLVLHIHFRFLLPPFTTTNIVDETMNTARPSRFSWTFIFVFYNSVNTHPSDSWPPNSLPYAQVEAIPDWPSGCLWLRA